MNNCLICNLNATKEFLIEEANSWQIDKPKDIMLNGLFFVKTKRHVESIAEIDNAEQKELGPLLQKYSLESQRIASANHVITLNLGLKEPHLHFWIIPISDKTLPQIKHIGKAVKEFADYFRK